MRNTMKLSALLMATSVALAGCAGGSPSGAEGGVQDITIRTDYQFNGYITPYALAIENGYFKEEGLNVKLELGQGSSTTVQTVASGQDQFGIADSGTVIKAVTNEDIPVKVLSVHLQKIPMGFIHKPENAVKSPKDLLDRVIIGSAGTAELSLLPAILQKDGLDPSGLKTQLVGAESRIPQLLSNPDRAVLLGFATGDYLRAKAADPTVTYTSFSEFGLSAYGTGLIARNDTVDRDPELVKKVVRAVQRGWAAAVEDPDAAVAAGLKIQPNADKGLLLEGLKVSTEELLHTPKTEGKPLGWTSNEDWEAMLDLFHQYAGMEEPKNPEEYYTNDFIPEL